MGRKLALGDFLLVAILTAPLVIPATAQQRGPKPDLNGVWDRPYVPDMTKSGKNQEGSGVLPFTTWGAEQWKKYDPADFDYTGHCLPQGLTRSMNSPFPIQIVQTPGTFVVLYEAWNVFHVAPLWKSGHSAGGRQGVSEELGAYVDGNVGGALGGRHDGGGDDRIQRQDEFGYR